MNKINIMYIVTLIIVSIFISGCGPSIPSQNTKYTIEVYANPGLEFQGNIGGGGNSQSIDGVGRGQTPVTYEVVGWPAVAVMQKQIEGGTLIVVMKDSKGKIISQQSTSAAYGVVTVSSG